MLDPALAAALSGVVTPDTKAKMAAKGWLPAPPVADSPMELLDAPAVAPAAAPAPVVGALPAAPPVAGDATSPALLPAAPKPIAADAPKPPPVDAAPPPAPSDVVQVGKPGAPMAPLAGAPLPPPPPPKPMPAMGGGGPLPMGPAAPAAPVDHTKFGYTPSELSAQKHVVGSMETQKGFAAESGAVDTAAAEGYAGIAQKFASDIDAKAAEAESKAKKRQQFLADFNAETQKQIDDYVKSDVDPNRWWSDGNTGQKVLAIVGVALGGMGQMLAMRGGADIGNPALAKLEQTIQADIDRQKAMIAKKGVGIEARRGLYASYLQQFGSEDVAENAAMATYLQKTKAQIDALAAKTTSEQTKIQAKAMIAAIDDKIVQYKDGVAIGGEKMYDAYQTQLAKQKQAYAAAMQAKLDKRDEAIQKVMLSVIEKKGLTPMPLSSPVKLPSGVVLPAGSIVAIDAKGQIDMDGTEAAQKAGKSVVVNVPQVGADGGSPGYMTVQTYDAEAAKELSKKSAGAVMAIGALKQMQDAAAMPGPWVGDKYNKYKQAKAAYITGYFQAKGLGAPSAADKEIADSTVPAVPTYGAGALSSSEKALIPGQIKTLSDELKQLGYVYGTPGAAPAAPLPLTAPKPAGQ